MPAPPQPVKNGIAYDSDELGSTPMLPHISPPDLPPDLPWAGDRIKHGLTGTASSTVCASPGVGMPKATKSGNVSLGG